MSKIIMIMTETVHADQYGRIMDQIEKAIPDCFLYQEDAQSSSFAVPNNPKRSKRSSKKQE